MDNKSNYKDFSDMSRDELLDLVEELLMECDERHAHEEALERQINSLGHVPISFSETSPFDAISDNFSIEA